MRDWNKDKKRNIPAENNTKASFICRSPTRDCDFFLFNKKYSFYSIPAKKYTKQPRGCFGIKGIICDDVMDMTIHSGRSPPFNLGFQKNQDWRNEHEG